MQTDKKEYKLEENVEMLYRVTNLGGEGVKFGYGSIPHLTDLCDFIVEKNGERIWDKLPGPFGFFYAWFTINPSESKEFTTVWNMTYKNGNKIMPGDYNVTGMLSNVYLEHKEKSVPVSVPIKIIQ